VPAFDMVIVTTGANDYVTKQAAIMTVAQQHLLPGLR